MGRAENTNRAEPPRSPAEALVWHPAKLSNLQMRVWLLVASGVHDIGVIAERAEAPRTSVSRALTCLCEHGLVRRPDKQDRLGGRFGGYSYGVFGVDGNPR